MAIVQTRRYHVSSSISANSVTPDGQQQYRSRSHAKIQAYPYYRFSLRCGNPHIPVLSVFPRIFPYLTEQKPVNNQNNQQITLPRWGGCCATLRLISNEYTTVDGYKCDVLRGSEWSRATVLPLCLTC